MNRKMKKRFCFIMALLLSLTLIPGPVSALEEGEQGHNHTEGYCYVCQAGDPSLGQSYNVPGDYEEETPAVYIGETPYQSLAEAVQMAASGDTLSIQRNVVLSSPIMIEKDLNLQGAYDGITITRSFSGEAMVTVRGGASVRASYLTFDGGLDNGYSGYSIFNVLGGSVLTLSDGVRLTAGKAGYGGGVYVDAYSLVQMNGESAEVRIERCLADYSGGAIYSEGIVQVLQNAWISGNQANYGGGIWTLSAANVMLTDPGAVYGNTDAYGAESNLRDASAQEQTEPYAEAVIHTVSFDPGNGSEAFQLQVDDGGIVSQPEGIYLDGYVLTGWVYMPYDDGVYYAYDFSQPVYSDLNLYANWEQAETPAPETEPEPQPESDPDPAVQPESDPGLDPAWDPQPEPEPQPQPQPEPQPEPEPVSYQVSFDYGMEGWEMPVQTVQAGGYAVDPYDPNTMYQDQYTFAGWFYYTTEGEFQFAFDQPVYQDYYLTAKWNQVTPDYVNVTYDPNDGVSETSAVQILRGELASPASASREGYTFDGWYYYDEYGDYVPYDFSLPVNSDLILYAGWSQVPEYTVTFDFNANGEIPAQERTVLSGQTVSDPYDPAAMPRSGWNFLGWFYTDEYGDEYPFDFSYAITSDWALYAKWERTAFLVTYDFNADGEIPAQTVQVEAGGFCTPPDIARPGYELENWYVDSFDGTEVYDFASPVEYDLTLTAQWIPIETGPSPEEQMEELGEKVRPLMLRGLGLGAEETPSVMIRFYPNNGTEDQREQAADAGTPTLLLKNPFTYEGFQFTGWNTQADGSGASYADEEEVTLEADLELYAQWEELAPPEATVTLDANHGTGETAVQSGEPNTTITLEPNTFVYEGYRFAEWNTQPDGSGSAFADGAEVLLEGNLVLYAQWLKEISVIYQANSNENIVSTQVIPAGTPTPLNPNPFTYEGFQFTGWNTEYDGSGTAYGDGEVVTFSNDSENLVLFAQWEELPPLTVQVTFDANHGTGETAQQSGEAGSSISLNPNPFTYEGYSFTGWNTQSDGSGITYADGASFQLGEVNSVLYAQWQALPADAKLNYHANGGEGTMNPGTGKQGDSVQVSPNSFTRAGYSFTGWNTLADGTGETYAAGAMFQLTGTENDLYAQWTAQQTGAVLNYHANGGEGTMEPGTGKQGSSIAAAANGFTRTGYIFTSWNTLADGTGTAYVPGTSFTLTGAVNDLYAQWEIQNFTVTFDPCTGSDLILQTVPYGQKVSQPAVPAPAGYRLEGWYKEAGYVNKFDFNNTAVTGNFTLFAKWEQIPVKTFTVTFYTERGTAPAAQSVQEGQNAYKPADPYAEGFLFGGWYLDQAYMTLYNFNSPVTSDISLYAKWAARPDLDHVVSFDANGHGNAPNPQIVKGGALAQKPAAPAATGYTFTGWFTDASCTTAFNFQQPVTADITLYAGWTVNRYTIRFDSNTGTGTMASIGVAYDQRVSLPANAFAKSGFYFLGWNTKADGTGVFVPDQGQILNLTDVNGGTVDLYAQWKNIYNIIEGANAQVMKGTGKGLTFRCDGDYNKFTGIKVDGRTVPTNQYTSSAGSTVVTLHADYVNQLPAGKHTIRFEYIDGGVETSFELLSATPTTGDTNNALIWIIVGIAALLIIAAVIAILLVRRRRDMDDDPYFDDFDPDSDQFRRDYEYGDDDIRNEEGFEEDDFEEEDDYERYVDDQLKRRGSKKNLYK